VLIFLAQIALPGPTVGSSVWNSPNVAAAIVAGLFALAVPTATAFNQWRKLRLANNELTKLSGSFEAQLGAKYGLSAEISSCELAIKDPDGGCAVTRRWEGLSVHKGVVVTSLPGKMVGSQGTVDGTGLELIHPVKGFNKALVLETLKNQGSVVTYRVQIEGWLTSDDPPLDFGVKGGAEKMFAMTKEEAVKALPHFPHEFMGISVDYPTKRLKLNMSFGGYFTAQPFPFVFMGFDGEVPYPNRDELTRIKAGFKANPTHDGAELIVDTPLIGLLYVIYWDPPKAPKAGAKATA